MTLAAFGTNFCVSTKFFRVSKSLAFEATDRVWDIEIYFDIQISILISFGGVGWLKVMMCVLVFRLWPSSDRTVML